MKKLMIAAAIVCAAAMSQAAVTNWKITAGTTGKFYDGYLEGKNVLKAQEIYVIAVATDTIGVGISQANLISAFKSQTADNPFNLASYAIPTTSGANHNKTTSSGTLTGSSNSIVFGNGTEDSGEFTGGKTYKFYLATIVTADDKDYLYISDTFDAAANSGTSQKSLTASGTTNTSKEMGPYSDTSAAGWYTAVPEPTSGLLLLLGVAGLALRRRRA